MKNFIFGLALVACQDALDPTSGSDDARLLTTPVLSTADPRGADLSVETQPVCTLPVSPGSCKANFEVWGFNQNFGRCTQFVWGGCDGNANRFETESACNGVCGKQTPTTCLMPADAGPCKGVAKRWAWNRDSQQCQEFNYGLCEGNANNYVTEEECLSVCRM